MYAEVSMLGENWDSGRHSFPVPSLPPLQSSMEKINSHSDSHILDPNQVSSHGSDFSLEQEFIESNSNLLIMGVWGWM